MTWSDVTCRCATCQVSYTVCVSDEQPRDAISYSSLAFGGSLTTKLAKASQAASPGEGTPPPEPRELRVAAGRAETVALDVTEGHSLELVFEVVQAKCIYACMHASCTCTHIHAHAHAHASMHMGSVCSPDRQVDLGGCPDSTAWPYSLLPRTSMADTQIRTSEQHVHVVAHPQLQPQLQRSALPMRTLLTRAPTWTFSACCCLLAPTANRTRTHQVHSK